MDAKQAGTELRFARRTGALAKRIRGWGVPGVIKKLVGSALSEESLYLARGVLDEHPGGLSPVFGGMSDKARLKLTRTLLPKLCPSVESAWQAMGQRPYQWGTTRKPFRCPNAEADMAEIRGGWLLRTALTLGDYERDIAWVATWAAHIADWQNATELGWLLAGALNQGGSESDEVLEILKASACGDHEIAQMGRHVTQALMSSNREDAWEFNEKLLLAAQRQEGLRQTILESVDESHPEAFRRMLRLILEEDLSRFSSVVRAFDTWFGFMWDGASGIKVNEVLEKVLLFFGDPVQRSAAMEGPEAEPAYLALWTLAFEDVETAIRPATRMLDDSSAEKRFVATHLLAQTGWMPSRVDLARMLGDDDLRVAARALMCFRSDSSTWVESAGLFAELERLLARLSKRSRTLDSIVWPWWRIKLERTAVAEALSENSKGVPLARMLPHIRDLDSYRRERYVRTLAGLPDRWPTGETAKPKALIGAAYEVVIDLLGDTSPDVRTAAFQAISATPPKPLEVDRLVGLLNRKAGDLRNRCIERLRALPEIDTLRAGARLLEDKDGMRRLAGLELLRDAVERERGAERARESAVAYRDGRGVIADAERAHLDAILQGDPDVAGREDALGLVDPASLPTWPGPTEQRVEFETRSAARCVDSLARLILENQDFEIDGGEGDRVLLINAGIQLRGPGSLGKFAGHEARLPLAEQEAKLPLAEKWRSWAEGRAADLRDRDGLELVRAWVAPHNGATWAGRHATQLRGAGKWSAGASVLSAILKWCIYWEKPERSYGLLLGGLESCLSRLQDRDFADMVEDRGTNVYVRGEKEKPYRQRVSGAESLLWCVRDLRRLSPEGLPREYAVWLYGLLRWFQLRSEGYGSLQIQLEDFVGAHRSGGLGDAGVPEFVDLLVGRCSEPRRSDLLEDVSGQRPATEIADFPELQEAVERCRRRVVEVESRRGDRKTAASTAAMKLKWSGGLETVSLAMRSLGSTKFARSYSWAGAELSRKETLSNLIIRSTPREGDSPDAFASWFEDAGIKEARLVELAAFAPQWSEFVNRVLEWPGLESAVWWIHAHTKDDRWRLRDLRESWAAQVSERTPLSALDLTEGAVDVQWFHEAHSQLGAERWKALYKAAKYASSSGGHKRAQLFAGAMLGEVTLDEVWARIDDKRHQDSVRAFGLIPLAVGKDRRSDLLGRYQRLQEFKRESRKFGSQRQASEKRAMTIGLENLARTAGFKDPLRLQWAMEMEAVKDLVEGPVTVTKDDVSLILSIDDDGKPGLSVLRKKRKLKSIPAGLRKDAEVAKLKERLKELRRQSSRVKVVLEEAMCRGDVFDGSELRELLQHPILAPSLSRLVFVGDGIVGYPVEGGRALSDQEGKLEPVRKNERLRIAHPDDLLSRGDWTSWQRECFRIERVQPFKQVFRELYPITESERADKHGSRRYAGHQVNPGQALALLGGRGWVAQPEEGVSRTYHNEGLTARLGFAEAFYTPADIEGLTLETVVFTEKQKWDPLDLAAVPPRVFSETMRDLDLVVSVAHQGGVDPEATASTVEMRASLLRETCSLLGVDNVEVKDHNVIVRGHLGDYSVHLGSALVTLLGGPSLVIVAVQSQHRGRLFLPFADDDPRTAEVMSKVLLLARDREIKDPGILEQIRGAQR